MSALIGRLNWVVASVFDLVYAVCDTIMDHPILLMTMGILLLGGAIGIFGRLLSRG